MEEFCRQHIDLSNALVKIQTSMESIEKTVCEGVSFKNGIIASLAGMSLIILIQISTFAFLYGKMVNQVEVNTERLLVIEKVLAK